MFSISFFISPNTAPIVLLFKGEESLNKAMAAYDSVDSMTIGGIAKGREIEDDFGQKLRVSQNVAAVLVQDLKLAQQVDIERGVHHAVTQALATERAKTDPTIARTLRGMNQGPAVLNPFGMNGGGRPLG